MSGILSRSNWGFQDLAPIISQFSKDVPLKAHTDYKAAKSGDIEAAIRMVESMLYNPEYIASIKHHFVNVDYLLPIVAQELQGDNAIPLALAALLADKFGGVLYAACFQTNKAYHTGADPMERLISRATFGGTIIPNQTYVLIDDVTAMGSTLADCAAYIADQGGTVIGAIVLTNASRSGKLKADAKDLRLIKERYDENIKDLFSIDPYALTYDEARYLVGFKTPDELRNRATKAAHERENRIASKKIPKP